ncbi:leucine-rich repeat domain-containing protein [uncultured Robinsoniella sp.]|uniref:leucine-rich repeat domain-containing protein n=1 Tax=uncultured Robinsoniella sp. TaxID=904190 RepID=UPI00374E63B5
MVRHKNILKVIIIVTLFIILFPLNVSAAKTIPNDRTGIPDEVLYQSILRKLGKSKFDTFTDEEAMKIKRIKSNNYNDKKKIKTLKGIEKLKNLKQLDVAVNEITSLSGIENLKLTSLDISHNKLKSLKWIEKLTNLKSLNINDNHLTSIKELKSLVNLEALNIDSNRIRNVEEIGRLTQLQFFYASNNRIKKIPDLNMFPNLLEVELKYNRLSERELNKKLSPRFTVGTTWFKSQVKLQNLVKTIKIVKPASTNDVSKNTKKISGIANKNSTISLRDPKGKKIVSVKTDNKGKFTFKNLNLKKWAGMTLSLQSYVVDQLYGEKNILKEVKFTVR